MRVKLKPKPQLPTNYIYTTVDLCPHEEYSLTQLVERQREAITWSPISLVTANAVLIFLKSS